VALASLNQQLQNPVGMFAQDNNGVIISLPSVPAAGTTNVSGSMIFGIGTRGNNGLGNAQIIPLNPNFGTFITTLNSTTYSSVIDSGSNGLFFAAAIAPCAHNIGFYCPTPPLTLSATNQGTSGPASIVNFQVANADSLLANNPSAVAFSNLAGTNTASSFDWGLPFFFGRKVFTAIEGQATPEGVGPFMAY
jgi:hypothetical protein